MNLALSRRERRRQRRFSAVVWRSGPYRVRRRKLRGSNDPVYYAEHFHSGAWLVIGRRPQRFAAIAICTAHVWRAA